MVEYIATKVKLSPGQMQRLKSAIKNDEEMRIQINMLDIDVDTGVMLNLTKTQVDRLKGLDRGKAARITLSKTQLKSMKYLITDSSDTRKSKSKSDEAASVVEKLVELSLSPSDVEKIKKVRFNDVPGIREFDGDSIFSGLVKVALPFIKKTLPKILGTLGLAAATGGVQAAVHKKVAGKGLKRSGGAIKISKKQLEEIMKLGNLAEECKCVEKGFVDKMNKDLKMQRAGFIGTLAASLIGSLLPSLISGNGLKRANTSD